MTANPANTRPGGARRRGKGLLVGAAVVAVAALGVALALAWAGPAVEGPAVNRAVAPGGTPELVAAFDDERRELVLDLGPFQLSAGATHHDVDQPPALTVESPVSGWIHGFSVEIVDGDGRAVPQQVLHHINVIEPEHRELFSPIMRRIAAAGQETDDVRLTRLVGYPVREGGRILVVGVLHNPLPEAYEDVRLRIRFPVTLERRAFRPRAIYPFYLDVMPPASVHAYDLPPGRSEQSWEGSPAVSGRVLGVGGHLHRYGVLLRLEDVTRGRVLWEAEPVLAPDGEIEAMPTRRFLWRLGLPLRNDRVYRLTAVYENPEPDTIPLGAMGTLGGAFRPSRGGEWPPADPEHPEYQLDLRLVTEGKYHHAPAESGPEPDHHHHHH